jgi:stearoyl-CoA desaturase (delta-9 desaturase)
MEENSQFDSSSVTAEPGDERQRTTGDLRLRLINLTAVTLPFVGFVVAIVLLWGVAFNWVYLALFAGMYIATGIGITVGYHRYFTHRSFKTSRPVAAVLAALGSMAVEGPLLQWVATHRCHHQHSDQHDDPHSPHTHGGGLWGTIRGMWHAHMGWIFSTRTFVPTNDRAARVPQGLDRYVGDLRREPLYRWMNATFPLWVLVGLLIPAALGGLLTMSWTGVLLGLVWGGLVRIFFVHHVTWSVNSVCHIWGTRPFRNRDESRNNPVFGVLALGEGWHNNHHAFPTSARHGLRWWQLDLSYLIIRLMAVVRLARDVRLPTPERIAAKRCA